MAYTADDLIDSVRLRANLPSATADDKLSDTDILTLADEQIRSRWVPYVSEKRSAYYVRSELLTTSSGYARVPSRAVGGALIDVQLAESGSENACSIPEITIAQREFYNAGDSFSSRLAYSFEGDKIKIHPYPANDVTLRVFYQWRPGQLVKTNNITYTAAITSVTSSTVVASGGMASNITTGTAVDIVQATPNYDLLVDGASDTTVGGGTVTFSTTNPSTSDVAVGDYLCDAGYTPIVHVPEEVFPLVVSSVVIRVLMMYGEYEQLAIEREMLAEEAANVSELLTPRNKGERRKVVNRYGALRSGYRGGKTW